MNQTLTPIRKTHIGLLVDIVRNQANLSADELNWVIDVYAAIKKGNKLTGRVRDDVVTLYHKSQIAEVSIIESRKREQDVKDHITRIRRVNRIRRDFPDLRVRSHRRHVKCSMKTLKSMRRS